MNAFALAIDRSIRVCGVGTHIIPFLLLHLLDPPRKSTGARTANNRIRVLDRGRRLLAEAESTRRHRSVAFVGHDQREFREGIIRLHQRERLVIQYRETIRRPEHLHFRPIVFSIFILGESPDIISRFRFQPRYITIKRIRLHLAFNQRIRRGRLRSGHQINPSQLHLRLAGCRNHPATSSGRRAHIDRRRGPDASQPILGPE